MDTVKIRGKNEPLSDHLTNVFEESEKLRIKIKEAHKEGDNCLKQAKWIGLDGYLIFYYIFNCYNAQLLYLDLTKTIERLK